MNTDAQLKKEVTDELGWDPAIHETEIGVAVKDGVVTLTGQLDTPMQRSMPSRRPCAESRA